MGKVVGLQTPSTDAYTEHNCAYSDTTLDDCVEKSATNYHVITTNNCALVQCSIASLCRRPCVQFSSNAFSSKAFSSNPFRPILLGQVRIGRNVFDENLWMKRRWTKMNWTKSRSTIRVSPNLENLERSGIHKGLWKPGVVSEKSLFHDYIFASILHQIERS